MVIRNISQYNKKDYDTIVDYIFYQMPRLRRSRLVLKSELYFHSWCYRHKLWEEHTKDCDITEHLTHKEWFCYHTVGLMLYWLF